MITSYIRNCIAFAIFLSSFSLFSQNDLIAFFEPSFAVNHKVNDSYKVNFATVARNYMYRNSETEFTVRHLQLAHIDQIRYVLDIASEPSNGLPQTLQYIVSATDSPLISRF